jgi:hypothetical protein
MLILLILKNMAFEILEVVAVSQLERQQAELRQVLLPG